MRFTTSVQQGPSPEDEEVLADGATGIIGFDLGKRAGWDSLQDGGLALSRKRMIRSHFRGLPYLKDSLPLRNTIRLSRN
jgi:hypothetical protein